MPLCKKILTRLFRVFVHVYIHHFDRIISIGAVSIIISWYNKKIKYLAYNVIDIYRKNLKKLKIKMSINTSIRIKIFVKVIPCMEQANINRHLVKLSSI